MTKIMLSAILLFSNLAYSQVSKSEFELLKDALRASFEEINSNHSESFSFNFVSSGPQDYWWNVDAVYFSYVQIEKLDLDMIEHRIYLMGGLAKLKGMEPDSLAIAACHEMGHGKGGTPSINIPDIPLPVSVEGQSDYFAAKVCLPIVMKHLKPLRKIKSPVYNQKSCRKQTDHSFNECLRMLNAIEGMIALFKHHYKVDTFVSRPSKLEVTELVIKQGHYPEPQCRVDTYVNGILARKRPSCWYPKN